MDAHFDHILDEIVIHAFQPDGMMLKDVGDVIAGFIHVGIA